MATNYGNKARAARLALSAHDMVAANRPGVENKNATLTAVTYGKRSPPIRALLQAVETRQVCPTKATRLPRRKPRERNSGFEQLRAGRRIRESRRHR